MAKEEPKNKNKLEQSSKKEGINPWTPTAFVQEGDRLPPGYTGLDSTKFLEMFKSRVEGLKRGEFESTDDFTKRANEKDTLLAPINTFAAYAFRIENAEIKYDADAEAYIISYPCHMTRKEDMVTCTVKYMDWHVSSYSAGNSYGANFTVEKMRGKNFALANPKGNALIRRISPNNRYIYRDTISVPVDKARILSTKKIAVLFVGQISDAKIIRDYDLENKPTFNSPKDHLIIEEAISFTATKIYYYVIETGEIINIVQL